MKMHLLAAIAVLALGACNKAPDQGSLSDMSDADLKAGVAKCTEDKNFNCPYGQEMSRRYQIKAKAENDQVVARLSKKADEAASAQSAVHGHYERMTDGLVATPPSK